MKENIKKGILFTLKIILGITTVLLLIFIGFPIIGNWFADAVYNVLSN